jgi:methyl-accepting chemotaxis protein
MAKLMSLFVLVAAIPILIVGYLSFAGARDALEKTQFERLYSERELRKAEVIGYLNDLLLTLTFLSETAAVQSAVEKLVSYYDHGKSSPSAPLDIRSDAGYLNLYAQTHPLFLRFLNTYTSEATGYRDIMIIGAKDGTVLYTVRKDKDFGANLKTGDLKGSSLATLWEKVVDIRKPATMDFAIYPTTGEPEAFMGVPVLDERGYLRGVLAI